MRTALYTTEVQDQEPDYLSIDVRDFKKLSRVELESAYNRLTKAMRYVFTGSISPIINRIDINKVQQ